MKTIKLVKTFIFMLLVTNSLTSCMSEDESPIFSPITRRSNLNLPPLSTSSSLDSELANVLESIQRAQREQEQPLSRQVTVSELKRRPGGEDSLVSRVIITPEKYSDYEWIDLAEIVDIGERFPNVRELTFSRVDLGRVGLEWLSEQPYAPNLTTLTIAVGRIPAVQLPSLRAFTSLTNLNLYDNQIGNRGLEILSEQPFASQLTRLGISSTGITAAGVQSLRAFSGLRELDISNNNIGNEGLTVLAQLPIASQLISLDISHNGVTREVWEKHKHAFTSLEYVNIS